ncbi:UbiA prenyltransferase family-domain-containing protein [Xylariaceae sp. FL0594]|nr:UbiA prenyltransferase family-domain-containing protein [Xylariaceae sp. FL0594]
MSQPEKQPSSLPEYSPPTKGILSYLPASWVPYGELARIDKPTGVWHFYFPQLLGTLFYAACHRTEGEKRAAVLQPGDLLSINALLYVGTVFFRSAACALNDTLDPDFDRQVRRCRLRPLARGALTPAQGYAYTVALAGVAVWFIALLPPHCWAVSVPSVLLATAYPFAKRVTDFPQAVLGVQQAIGVLVGAGAAAMQTDRNPLIASNIASLFSKEQQLRAVGALYLAVVWWEVVIDTVYALQDVEDDEKAGVRSMALYFRGHEKALLGAVAALQVASLLAVSVWAGFGPTCLAISCGGVATSLAYMLWTIDLARAD